MRLLDWSHVQADYHSLLCTRRSIHHAGGLRWQRCYIYMPEQAWTCGVNVSKFYKISVETRLQVSKETKSLDVFTGWMECEYLIMPSLQPMSNIFRFIIKPCCKVANEAIRKLGMIKSGFKNRSKDIMLPLYKSMLGLTWIIAYKHGNHISGKMLTSSKKFKEGLQR